MKNAFTLKIKCSLLFLFCSVFLFGQEHSLNFQVKQGFTNFRNLKRDYSDFEKFNIIGGDFSIGLNYSYSFFPKKYFTGSIGVLWNHYSFAQRRISRTSGFLNSFFNPYDGYERTRQFESQSLMFPICAKTQIWKIGLSFGLAPRYHLKTKMYYEEIKLLKDSNFDFDLFSNIYVAGETIHESPLNKGRGQRSYLKDQMDMQLQFGITYFLTEKMSFELEYRRLIHDNDFVVNSENYEGRWNLFVSKYEFSMPTISIGMNYKIF